MMKRLAVSGALLRGGLPVVLVALAAPLLSALPAAEAPPAELFALSLLPSSADLVIWVDYSALRKSELVAEMESRIDALPDAAEHYREFVRQTGVDPRQDTDQVMMSLRQADGAGGEGFLLVAQGRFAGSRLVDAAAAKGGKLTTTPKGIRIWTSGEQGPSGNGPAPKPSMALAQPSEGVVLFGSEPEVQRAANVAIRAKSPAARENRFRDLLAGVDRKAPLWAVLDSQNLAKQVSSEIEKSSGGGGANAGEAFAAVASARMSAYVGKDVDLRIQVDGKDPESAGLLADLFRGIVAAGKLAAKDSDPELLKILQEMSLVETGTGVEMKVRIPASRLRLTEEADPAE